MDKTHPQTVADCDKRSSRLWWAVKLLSAAVVAMLASILVIGGVGWGAAATTKAMEKEVGAVKNSQEQDRTYLRDTLSQIQADVREIRETQIRMLRNHPPGGG